MQHPVVWGDLLVDIGVVDGRADDEKLAGDVHTVTKALENFSLGGVLDRQRGGNGSDQQPALVDGVLLVHKHNAIVLLCRKGRNRKGRKMKQKSERCGCAKKSERG